MSAALAADSAVQKWKLHLPLSYDNAHPAPPSPDVGHHIENDRLNLVEMLSLAREHSLEAAARKELVRGPGIFESNLGDRPR